jgi:toxin YoeB
VKVVFAAAAWEDYLHWQATAPAILARVNDLIKECQRTPSKGTGKPEPLKGDLMGWWSRRVTLEDRLAYRVTGSGLAQQLEIAQCRLHY